MRKESECKKGRDTEPALVQRALQKSVPCVLIPVLQETLSHAGELPPKVINVIVVRVNLHYITMHARTLQNEFITTRESSTEDQVGNGPASVSGRNRDSEPLWTTMRESVVFSKLREFV
ncbi:hypothetical protein QAD02_008777 [Eretmocerus hayati]|uniref:Uncharacterized protein n=1 Tax=Eretmocerus hayati TaxID=131215 RepID=A0ACC2N7G1_9HYME|nr:hypothetical protein QAD02_008777 [Eretmocerus hayati]